MCPTYHGLSYRHAHGGGGVGLMAMVIWGLQHVTVQQMKVVV